MVFNCRLSIEEVHSGRGVQLGQARRFRDSGWRGDKETKVFGKLLRILFESGQGSRTETLIQIMIHKHFAFLFGISIYSLFTICALREIYISQDPSQDLVAHTRCPNLYSAENSYAMSWLVQMTNI